MAASRHLKHWEEYAETARQEARDPGIREIKEEMKSVEKEMLLLRGKLSKLNARLESTRQPYREKLALLEDKIKTVTMRRQESIRYAGVTAKYFKAKRSRKWKTIALEAGATNELIELHTSHSDPRVVIVLEEVE